MSCRASTAAASAPAAFLRASSRSASGHGGIAVGFGGLGVLLGRVGAILSGGQFLAHLLGGGVRLVAELVGLRGARPLPPSPRPWQPAAQRLPDKDLTSAGRPYAGGS